MKYLISILILGFVIHANSQETEFALVIQEADATELFDEFKANWDTTNTVTQLTLFSEIVIGKDTLYIGSDKSTIFNGDRNNLKLITSGYQLVAANKSRGIRTFQHKEKEVNKIRLIDYVRWLYRKL
jgi:hypothetical protein